MLRNVIVYFTGGLALKLGGIVLLPIFTRRLEPSEYGTLELLNRATDMLLLCLFLSGTCLAAVAFYNQTRDDGTRRRVVGSVLVLNSAFIGVIGAASFALARPIGVLIGVGDPSLVRLAFSAALLDALVTIGLSLIQARVESVRYTVFAMAGLLLRVALILIFVCQFNQGIRGILLASLLTSGSLALILIAMEVRRSGLHFHGRTLRDLAWFALPFLPGGFCGLLLGTGDQLILIRYTTMAEIGLYALGYKLAMMVGIFSRDPLMKVWGSRMYQVADDPEAPRIFGQIFTGFVFAYLMGGLGLTLFGREVIAVLGQARYLGAADYIPLIVLAYLLLGGSDFMDAAFYLRRRSDIKLWITLATTTITLALYLILIPPYKAFGAAYATVMGFAFRAALTYVVSLRYFRVVYEWNRLANMLITAISCWLLAQFVAGPIWVTSPVKVALILMFPATLWLTGQLTVHEKEVLAILQERMRKRFPWPTATSHPAARET